LLDADNNPADVQKLVIRLLSQEQATRFPNAAQVLSAIRNIQPVSKMDVTQTVLLDRVSLSADQGSLVPDALEKTEKKVSGYLTSNNTRFISGEDLNPPIVEMSVEVADCVIKGK